MKKRVKIMGVILLFACFFACCNKPTSYQDGKALDGSNGEQNEKGIPVEEDIEQIDESAVHITLQLGEKVKIDADVTPKNLYDKELGNYWYKFPNMSNGTPQATRCKDLYEYGEKYEPLMLAGVAIFHDMPWLYRSEDEILVRDMVPEIMEDAKTIGVPVKNFQNIYRSVHFDEQLYKNVEELYAGAEESIPFPGEMSFLETRREFYYVSFQHEIEKGIPLLNDQFVYFSVDGEAEVKGIQELTYDDYPAPYCMIPTGVGPQAVLGKDKEILTVFDSESHFEIEGKKDANRVKSLKEMLHILGDEFANTMRETTIFDIQLVYAPYLSKEKDENGVRLLYLAPYWAVSYHDYRPSNPGTTEERPYAEQQLYLAATGEKAGQFE